MSTGVRRPLPTSPATCPGIKDFIRPTMTYKKCLVCGGSVELWSDEKVGVCLDCGADWNRVEQNSSCLDYCDFADKCKEIIKERTN